MTAIHVVWFKRDLRIADHRPLAAACRAAAAEGAAVLPLFVAEPGWWRQADMAGRHWAFVAECLTELRRELAARGSPLAIRIGETVPVLRELHDRFGIVGLWSHRETGGAWTHERDKRVAAWAREAGIAWTELPQHGVIRGLRDRDGWARRWDRFMGEPATPAPESMDFPQAFDPGPLLDARSLGLADDRCPDRQSGGRTAGLDLLASFLDSRGQRYRTEMSSPLTAGCACSRLSPHLAWGTLSVREAAQAGWGRIRALRGLPRSEVDGWRGSVRAFLGRLHWHCHFIQKLEDAPDLETAALHPAYAGLRPFDVSRHRAWAEGRTGWPFVDACMRSLRHGGWINFRMRAMLMAVSSYHLWNDWREPGLHLARLFTDYEPGIHWAQTQMQSGTTGINTARIYNPVKQSRDQDPDGVFIRRWVPELADVPGDLVHEPWRLSDLEQADLGLVVGRDYPAPMLDHMAAARIARDRIWSVRKGAAYREAAEAIQTRHGSRRSGLPPSTPRRRDGQDGRGPAEQRRLDLG